MQSPGNAPQPPEVKDKPAEKDFSAFKAQLRTRLETNHHELSSYTGAETKDKSGLKTLTPIQKYLAVKQAASADPRVAPDDHRDQREQFLQANAFTNFYAGLEKLLNHLNQTEINTKIVLGSIFNSPETLQNCIQSLKELEASKDKNTPEELKQKIADIFQPLKLTTLGKSEKFQEKIFNALTTSDTALFQERIQLLTQFQKCAEVFAEFRDCIKQLNDAGFYSVNGLPVNFWSGTEAQKEAAAILTSLSDSNVPAISILSFIGVKLKESAQIDASNRDLSNKVFLLVSAELAKLAAGKVLVYSSTSSIHEENTFTVGNFHWEVELPVILMNIAEGQAEDCKVSYLNHDPQIADKFLPPEEIFTQGRVLSGRRQSITGPPPDEIRAKRIEEEKLGAPRPATVLSSLDISAPPPLDRTTTRDPSKTRPAAPPRLDIPAPPDLTRSGSSDNLSSPTATDPPSPAGLGRARSSSGQPSPSAQTQMQLHRQVSKTFKAAKKDPTSASPTASPQPQPQPSTPPAQPPPVDQKRGSIASLSALTRHRSQSGDPSANGPQASSQPILIVQPSEPDQNDPSPRSRKLSH